MLTSVQDRTTQLFTHATTVDSSVIDSLIYDEDTQSLFVKFNNGSVAGYRDVNPTEFGLFAKSDSPGAYYNRYIRSSYRGLNSDVNFVPRVVESAPETDTVVAVGLVDKYGIVGGESTVATEGPLPTRHFRVSVVVEADNIAEAIEYVAAGVDGTIESVSQA